jgi:hypothetical protein
MSPCFVLLLSGWWYYERYTLARHEGKSTRNSDDNDNDGHDYYVSANRGELNKKTYLYPILDTSENDLADFGEGIGIYFYTLRVLSIIFFIAGLLSVPNILFFASAEWNPMQEFSKYRFLQASAVCTNHEWKVSNHLLLRIMHLIVFAYIHLTSI